MICAWAQECESHLSCAKAAQVPLPKRIIEIPADPTQLCILRTNHNIQDHYVILSHCWGKSGIPSKLEKSLISTYERDIPVGELPKSFQDAVKITRWLGFRYLWIDALCIIQDSPKDWAEEAPKMSSYYGLSTLMIAAATPEDSSKGILGDRHISYSPAIGLQGKYCISSEKRDNIENMSSSVLATRGWAAQERILAPRIVHYTAQQLI